MGMRFSWCFSGVGGGRERETSPFQLVSAFPLRGADYVNIDKPREKERKEGLFTEGQMAVLKDRKVFVTRLSCT